MSGRRKIFSVVLVIAGVGVAFVYAQVDIATKPIQFDLRKIGESFTKRVPKAVSGRRKLRTSREPNI